MSKLFVIAGHGAGDPGACGNGYSEAERVRALAQRIKDLGGSNVMLGDFNRNYYRDNGISNLTISKDYKILELHMDSSSSANAKGGHVIIKAGFKADVYDNNLANLMSSMFPGRANLIVGRSDLANVNRAANKGYNYRLMECGFISNADDVSKFNSRMDELAKGILSAFGIGTGTSSNTGSSSKPSTPSSGYTGNSIVDYLNSIGKDSSFSARKNYAAQYGISNYSGTASQNLALLNAMRGNSGSSASKPSVSYYPAFNSNSIVDGLKKIGVDSGMSNRKRIAAANGISNYTGTSSQNNTLCNLARQGKLKKA